MVGVVRSAVTSTFVAALELCRASVVVLDQDEDFRTVMVSPRADGVAEVGRRCGGSRSGRQKGCVASTWASL